MENKKELSWHEAEGLAVEVARQAQSAGFRPDVIVGITVGGMIPAALVAKVLGVRDVMTVSARSYQGTTQGALRIFNVPDSDLAGKRVLIVDDITDTGETLKEVARVLRERSRADTTRTATFVVRTDKCVVKPDFAALEATQWVVFPWEQWEDPVHNSS